MKTRALSDVMIIPDNWSEWRIYGSWPVRGDGDGELQAV
jgi:hypothetical protein